MKQKKKSPETRMHVLFEGHVQGVGFRYSVVSMADSYAVTGYVRNEPDGTVSLCAEGDAGELKNFLAAVRSSRLSRYIRNYAVSWGTPTGRFQGFGISY